MKWFENMMKRWIWSHLLFFLSGIMLTPAIRADIAFLGDSISTGGAAHPSLKFQRDPFVAVLRGESTLEPDAQYQEILSQENFVIPTLDTRPLRLYPSVREYRHPFLWFVDNLWISFGQRYLDAEKYSWSYLLARHLGFQGQDILIAAKDGERMEHGIAQADRVLSHTKGRVPDHMMIFFTGNDLCGPSFEFTTPPSEFREEVERTLMYWYQNTAPDSKEEKHIWLIEPVGVLQIVTSSSILSHQVPYQDRMISCKEMQTLKPEPMSFDMPENGDLADVMYGLVANAPSGYCPTLFAVHGEGGSEANVQIANRILGYREEIRLASQKLAPLLKRRNIFLHNVRETSKIVFEGEDMANDCFHLNLRGQIKIAKTVLKAMQDRLGTEFVNHENNPL